MSPTTLSVTQNVNNFPPSTLKSLGKLAFVVLTVVFNKLLIVFRTVKYLNTDAALNISNLIYKTYLNLNSSINLLI